MELDEFLNRSANANEELNVQKAVVESLAAEKVECDEQIERLQRENDELKNKLQNLEEQVNNLKSSLEKTAETLAKNTESEGSSKIALIDRNVDVCDSFVGETHDHILEVIKECRDCAEKEGRYRRAQILEGVLIVNEPVGNLAKRRSQLEKLFAENGNILSGNVISELEKMNISYKNGNDYKLPAEIINHYY